MVWGRPRNGRNGHAIRNGGGERPAAAYRPSENIRNGGNERPNEYRPSEAEPFMSEQQRNYFRMKLTRWKEDILRESRETLAHLQNESENHPDLADRASSETDRAIELRARDRQRKLINKIDAALERLEQGTYGFCEETGEPIAIKRLEARPIATLSIEAQERHERRERVYREE
jgi:DnaK suppressor protein